jgi:transcriptional regulator GlxA family with amidase domain
MTTVDGFAPAAPRRVAVLAFDGVVPFDFAVPCEVFSRASGPDGGPAYVVLACGTAPEVQSAGFGLSRLAPLAEAVEADTVVVPGVDDLDRPLPPVLLATLVDAHQRGARIASVCTGAFVLAAAGLLDGRRATTHWLAAAELARRHPRVEVDADVLYVDEGAVLTSAGAAAGIDLCLHLVRRDLGAAAAAAVARLSVMPLERAGGQAQFIVHPAPQESGALTPVLEWVGRHLERPHSVRSLARRAAMSERTFVRRFREQVGTTPARWIARARIARAQQLLETSALSVDEIAEAVGFGAASTLRDRFHDHLGTSPQAYRRAFREG